ncbi:DHHW family protein [Beduini massiliensis]|uniref:DHHW family protein n=1 Tax=Beduini massiliensis TaxID=1585974 RepID=UPI00059AADE2|nr:DHHW family protein [Beduini massiliensis]
MRDKYFVFIFVSILLFFTLSYLVTKDKEISNSERRHLTTFKDVKHYNITDSFYSKELEKYALDQVVFRDQWRYIKAKVAFDIFNKSDDNQFYLEDGHILKKEQKLDEERLKVFLNKANGIIQQYAHSKSKMLIIPGKEYYASAYSAFDYEKAMDLINSQFKGEFLDVRDQLALNDYYYSDPHLKQEAYFKLFPINQANLKKYTYQPFYGTYSSQFAYQLVSDQLNYFENPCSIEANYLETPEFKEVYNLDKLNNNDAYSVFLNGATPFVHLKNKDNKDGQTLLVFRDSFGSSLVPLLVDTYQDIYVVDLRYMNLTDAERLIDKEIDEILLVYGMNSINEGTVIK